MAIFVQCTFEYAYHLRQRLVKRFDGALVICHDPARGSPLYRFEVVNA